MRAFVVLVVLTSLGSVAALGLSVAVVMPALGVGNVGRVVALGQRIDDGVSPDIVMVGNSVTVEGLDAGLVAESAGEGLTAENWGLNGCAMEEVRLILPKVLRAGPGYVVLTLLPNDLGTPADILVEKSVGYSTGGFAAAWPEGEPTLVFPGISEQTAARMRSGWVRQALYFRSSLLDWVNREARLTLRRGVRRVPESDRWIRPFELTGSIGGPALDAHVREVVATVAMRAGERDGSGAAMLEAAVRTIAEGGARALVCIAPHHPMLREDVAAELDELRATGNVLRERYGAGFLDASELVGADGFADAIHPNAQGREAFSRAVGSAIAELEQTGRGR